MENKSVIENIEEHALLKKKEFIINFRRNDNKLFKKHLWKNINIWMLRVMEIIMLPLYMVAFSPYLKKIEFLSEITNNQLCSIVVVVYGVLFLFSVTPMLLTQKFTQRRFYEEHLFKEKIVDQDTMNYLVSVLNKEDLKRYILSQKTKKNENPKLTYEALLNKVELKKFIDTSNVSLESLLEKMYDDKSLELK